MQRLYRLDFAGLPPVYKVAIGMLDAIESVTYETGIHRLVSCYYVPPPPLDDPDPEYRSIRMLGVEVCQAYFDARTVAYGDDPQAT